MLEKILEELTSELDRRIDTQLRIIAGLNDEVYRYGFGKSFEAYQQAKLIVDDIIRKHMNAGKDTNVPAKDSWIPVEERLPEKRSRYLVTAESAGMLFCMIGHYNAPGWTEECSEQKMIAWQPLPDPYHIRPCEDTRTELDFMNET